MASTNDFDSVEFVWLEFYGCVGVAVGIGVVDDSRKRKSLKSFVKSSAVVGGIVAIVGAAAGVVVVVFAAVAKGLGFVVVAVLA